ncbi:ARPP-2 domain-containing protein [Deinococcus roseus]|uniref:ARG and Rhodanese-Phosphatase-superfamily-associated domain-containing protein n=1 Tax=Deinococcus roseus TaxID=392414 RepID=A0ABQ2CX39_9DEIO|nr:hypothetical protein [Deinococcus roseus]GGJ24688.1 hypothetical protein GCM10008938_08520 [Deinococcus roseus]
MKINDTLNLQGLRAAPSQVCGAFRLVPLIREKPCQDVRITHERYQQDLSRVQLNDGTEYWSFIPHGYILNWAKGNEATISFGAQLSKGTKTDRFAGGFTVTTHQRMVKRQNANSVRLLPLHLSMEAFLALYFGGPDIAWLEYSRFAKQHGLGIRSERAVSGRSLFMFEDALRTFEIHEGQVGVLIYTAEKLASAFVVPTPEDYRALHQTLLDDFYGELIYQYALWSQAQDLNIKLEVAGKKTLAELRQALHAARDQWAEFSTRVMGLDLLQRNIIGETIYKPAQLRLERFMTELDLNATNTIGERLVRSDGEVLYLKTFQLGADQTKRAWWLSQLSRHHWHIGQTAESLNMTAEEVVRSLNRAGFGYLLNPQILQQALKKR